MSEALIVAFTNTKGGVSKSTLSSHLVLWLRDRGVSVALLDADGKQRSSSNWITKAAPDVPVAVVTYAPEGQPEPYASVAEEIQAKLAELATHADVIVADTPGHANEAAHTVTLLCDIAVVPLQPSKLDVRAIRDAFKFIFVAQRVSNGNKARPVVVLTNTGKRDVQAKRLRQTIAETLGVPVLASQMRRLAAFLDSADTSVHRMKGPQAQNAALDIDAIFSELLREALPALCAPKLQEAANE